MACLIKYFILCSGLFYATSFAQYTITIYPEYLAQNGRSHFEADRWDGHNGLDNPQFHSPSRTIGTESGRWMNRDLNGNIFKDTPEDPHRKGYPDPNHFKGHNIQQSITQKYRDNLKAYGNDLDTVMEIKGQYWPHWMDTSQHGGIFPNNLDAGAEMTSLMLDGIKAATGGILPPYMEVINEPGTMWKHVTWTTVVEFHKVTAAKLKAKFPKMKVGGPTFNGAIGSSDKQDFRTWKAVREFLDMSLHHMDFFSFHPYNSFHSHGGSHYFRGTNEARLVGIIDLVESYSHQKNNGASVPLITSEFGLGNADYDSHTNIDIVRWAYAYLRNAYMFTFMNHRGVMEKAIAFLLAEAGNYAGAGIFDKHGGEVFTAKTYRFWHHFNYNQQFLRVDSQYNNAERTISPLVLADPNNKQVTVLLHNYKASSTEVRLSFHDRWLTPTDARSTCIYLDSHKVPHYAENQAVHLNNNHGVTLPSEASCFYTFQTGHNFGATPTVNEHVYYASAQALPIHNNVVQTTIYLPNQNLHTAQLRFGVSFTNKGAYTTPKSVQVNGHSVSGHYYLYDSNRPTAGDTLWDIFIYSVPTNILTHGQNTMRFEFNQGGGYVSTVGMITGIMSGNGHVIG